MFEKSVYLQKEIIGYNMKKRYSFIRKTHIVLFFVVFGVFLSMNYFLEGKVSWIKELILAICFVFINPYILDKFFTFIVILKSNCFLFFIKKKV